MNLRQLFVITLLTSFLVKLSAQEVSVGGATYYVSSGRTLSYQDNDTLRSLAGVFAKKVTDQLEKYGSLQITEISVLIGCKNDSVVIHFTARLVETELVYADSKLRHHAGGSQSFIRPIEPEEKEVLNKEGLNYEQASFAKPCSNITQPIAVTGRMTSYTDMVRVSIDEMFFIE